MRFKNNRSEMVCQVYYKKQVNKTNYSRSVLKLQLSGLHYSDDDVDSLIMDTRIYSKSMAQAKRDEWLDWGWVMGYTNKSEKESNKAA